MTGGNPHRYAYCAHPSEFGFSSICSDFYPEIVFLGPLNQEDPAKKVAAAPHIEASLVVGTSTSVAPLGGAPPLPEKIKLAQESLGSVQKLLAVSSRLNEYLVL